MKGKAQGMADTIYECTIANGQVVLPASIHLPENCRVWLTVHEEAIRPLARIPSPRLVHPEQAQHFEMEVEAVSDAEI